MGDAQDLTTSRLTYKTVPQLCAELDALTSWFSEHRVIKTLEEADSSNASSHKTPDGPSASNSGSITDSSEEHESPHREAVYGATASHR